MYHGIIQHKGYITEYLRDQILSRKLDQPQGNGRIYRVMHESTKRGPQPALSKATTAQLVNTLAHPNGWWRDTAQQLLVQRADPAAAPLLKSQAETAPDWRTRLHALWTLDGFDALEPSTVVKALDDQSRDVRASAVRLSERWLGDAKLPIQAAVLKKLDDQDWAVRRQLAATLGSLPDTSAKASALATLLERNGDDPITVDAALSGLSGSKHTVLERLLASETPSPQRTAAVATIAATIVRAGQDARVQDVFQRAADPKSATWQRHALLDGAEAALGVGTLPGTGRRGAGGGRGAAAAAANSTALGGRAGPGGAAAFPRTETGPPPAAGRGRGNTPLALSREPAGLRSLAAGGGETGKRAEALLTRLTWPGKPAAAGAAPAAAPLSAAEQQRFTEGEAVYKSLCLACHQANGEGLEKLGAPLTGSPFVNGPGHVAIRILLNGKEGPVGLMPPLGTTLSDDQIAGVLTYVRRSWGNQGSPIDAASVADVRKETNGRTRPWTEKELQEMVGK
jgi:mono/diheme cytochrome c family protein